ncbi:MAG: cupin domain-containing protein [Candidatus Pacebacteria bacterium]|nr:cupin domain-containing protein [Candidatus Paceibacterota bacterium]
MKGYISNIEKETKENENFRKVLYTAKNSQLVLMTLKPNEEIGEEVHDLDQFIRVEEGQGRAILDGAEYAIEDGSAIVIPSGMKHNIINGPDRELKLYTIYSPPEHKDKIVHITKSDAESDSEDHFDGITTE